MMRRPNHAPRLPLILLGIVLIAGGCSGGDGSSESEPEPVARVHVAIARADTLTETLRAYGVVIPAPGSVQSFAVPFEAVVDRVAVNAGQRVQQGQALVWVSLSPDVKVAAEQARAALASQHTVTDDTRQRFDMGLATRDELAQEKQALANARAQADKYAQWSQQKRLVAPASGLVREVLVSEGALAPAGSPLVSLALQQRFEVRLGVEPEDLDLLHVGQSVRLLPVDRSRRPPLIGRVRSVGQQVSPDTRLVEVLVAPPDGTDGLLLNQFVRAEIEVRGTRGLIVPRSAVLPHEDRFRLFTVRNGRAGRHEVEIGVETDSLVQVRGGGLASGDSVVVLGNYELTDSMRVRVLDASGGRTPR
jgi:membrane fusion protein (multidrug efflux system)